MQLVKRGFVECVGGDTNGTQGFGPAARRAFVRQGPIGDSTLQPCHPRAR